MKTQESSETTDFVESDVGTPTHERSGEADLTATASDDAPIRPISLSLDASEEFIWDDDLVVTVTTNFGSLSEDLMNRALPIHLEVSGNVADRESPIGNPRLEFLPANVDKIEAEFFGMIEKWKDEGKPLDEDVRHPFGPWAATIGGILLANGFTDFLANYQVRRTADDPIRQGLGLMGAARPDVWLQASAWAKLAVDLGLTKTVIPSADRDSDESRRRGIGVVLSGHRDETFYVETDDEQLTVKLEKGRRRFEEGTVTTRYRFEVLDRTPLPAEEEPERKAAD